MIKRVLYMTAVLLSLATAAGAQEPVIGPTPQRVSGGVVERDSTALDTAAAVHPQSPIFRDSLPISRVAALSLVAPGFGQLYNRHYWKLPVLYGTVGTLGYMAVGANRKYQKYKRRYDLLMSEYYAWGTWEVGANRPTNYDDAAKERFLHETVFPVQTEMNRYNTQRTVYFAGAAFTCLYFMADGVLNYPHPTTDIKRATTLALMFPGAGQFYNRSYWKVPIVIGVFGTMGYMIDWYNRYYQRYRTAYNNPGKNELEQNYNITRDRIQHGRDQARRNRDFFIILTGGAYLLSVIEAHVDAHLKDFDVSDDLTLRVEPTLLDMSDFYAVQNSGYPGFGMSMKIRF